MAVLAMSNTEIYRFDTLMRLERGELRPARAMQLLGLERSQLYRLLRRLRADGAAGLVSRKRGRPSNRRFSDAYRDRLAVTYNALLGQRWRDGRGREQAIGLDDILVVSPYNMQVELLKRTLPAGARVGTVDKFQGQEAAVVLISMATSSGDDLPRNVEFLYSRNRLNVAISRARCLAVIYANPRLLDIPCGTIAQMELVNGLCWARAYSEEQAAHVAADDGADRDDATIGSAVG